MTDEPAEVHERLSKIGDFVKVSKTAFADSNTIDKNVRAKKNFKQEPVALISKLIENAAGSSEIIDEPVKQILEIASVAVRQLETGVAVNDGRVENLFEMNILPVVPFIFYSDVNNTSPYCPTPKKQAPKALKDKAYENEKDDEENGKEAIPEPPADAGTNDGADVTNNENEQDATSESSSSSSSSSSKRKREPKSPSDGADADENEVTFTNEVDTKSSNDFLNGLKNVQEAKSGNIYLDPNDAFRVNHTLNEYIKVLKRCVARKNMEDALKFLSKHKCKIGTNYRHSFVKSKHLSDLVIGETDVSVIALRPLKKLAGQEFTVEVYSSLNDNWSRPMTKITTALRAIIFNAVVGEEKLPSEVTNVYTLVKWMKDQSKVDVVDAQSGINLNCNVPYTDVLSKEGKAVNFIGLVELLKKYEKEFKDKIVVTTGTVVDAEGSDEAKFALKFYRANCQMWLLEILAFQNNHENILKDYNAKSKLNTEAFSVLKKPPLTMVQMEELAELYNQTNTASITTYTNLLKKFLEEKNNLNKNKGNKKQINNTVVQNGETKVQYDQKITANQFKRTADAKQFFEKHVDEKSEIKLMEALTSDKKFENEKKAKQVIFDVVGKTFKSALQFAKFNKQAKGNGQIQNRRKFNPSSKKIKSYCFDFMKGSCTRENCGYRHITRAQRKAELKAVDDGGQ